MENHTELSPEQQNILINLIKTRFQKNISRFANVEWDKLEKKLRQNTKNLEVLNKMEITGGEPSLISYDISNDQYTFFDCSPESPKGRRSLCYDRKALDSRKENKPANSVIDLAESIGINILSEQEYRSLQEMGEYDLKTSSWIFTPSDIRNLGGAIFCDRRYNKVFCYHNGAESYYAARGFRGSFVL